MTATTMTPTMTAITPHPLRSSINKHIKPEKALQHLKQPEQKKTTTTKWRATRTKQQNLKINK